MSVRTHISYHMSGKMQHMMQIWHTVYLCVYHEITTKNSNKAHLTRVGLFDQTNQLQLKHSGERTCIFLMSQDTTSCDTSISLLDDETPSGEERPTTYQARLKPSETHLQTADCQPKFPETAEPREATWINRKLFPIAPYIACRQLCFTIHFSCL